MHLNYVQTYRFYQGLIREYPNDNYLVSPLTSEGYEVRLVFAGEATAEQSLDRIRELIIQ